MACSRLLKSGLALALVGGLLTIAGDAAASGREDAPPGEPGGANDPAPSEARMVYVGPPDPGSGCRPQC